MEHGDVVFYTLEYLNSKGQCRVKDITKYIEKRTSTDKVKSGNIGGCLTRLIANDDVIRCDRGVYELTKKGATRYQEERKRRDVMEDNFNDLLSSANKIKHKSVRKLLTVMDERAKLYETDSVPYEQQYHRVIKDLRKIVGED